MRALRNCRASYSQHGEDLVADGILGANYPRGRYVDIGCFDPQKWSNTYVFYLRGWSGICVEPNREYGALWQKYRPRDTFINVAVSVIDGTATYVSDKRLPWENRLSTLRTSAPIVDGTVLEVPTKRLDQILSEHQPHGSPIDLMSVDCEGHDLAVLRSGDFERFRPRVLIVEDKNRTGESELHKYCESLGYTLAGLATISKVFVDSQWLAERRAAQRDGSSSARTVDQGSSS